MKTGTDHTTPIHSHIWGHVDTWTVLYFIYLRRQGQTHQTNTLSFLGTCGHGDSSIFYIPTETGTDPTNPIHSHFWGLGDTSLYIDVETGTDTPPLYTLISGDVGTRGHISRIYRCGDRDRHTTPIHSHFWGLGDTGTLL